MKKKAISYIRFSTEKQELGSSLARQKERLEQWVVSHPEYELSSLSYKDLGVSGYDGSHVESGALGALLKACKEGVIEKDTVLLVESLDRLGRLPANDMFTLIGGLTEYLTIITLEDNQTYDKESFNNFKVYQLVGKVQQAYDYSKQLSERLLKARELTRLKAKKGDAIITKICPSWLKWDEKEHRFKEQSDRVEIVKLIFDMYLKGSGSHIIAKTLNQKKVPSFNGKGWHGSYVTKILFNRSVIGDITLDQRNRTGEVIEGYYPQIITNEVFYKAQTQRESRYKSIRTKKNDKPFNMFHGLCLCMCGTEMKLENKGYGQYHFQCRNRKRGLCNEATGFNEKLVVRHLCEWLYEPLQQHYNEYLLENYKNTENHETSIKDIDKKIKRITDMIIDAPDDEYETLKAKLDSFRKQKISMTSDVPKAHDSIHPRHVSMYGYLIEDEKNYTREMDEQWMKINTFMSSFIKIVFSVNEVVVHVRDHGVVFEIFRKSKTSKASTSFWGKEPFFQINEDGSTEGGKGLIVNKDLMELRTNKL